MNKRLGVRETCWGWGKEQHLYNTYLPIPSFLLSKHSLPGNQPTQAVAGSLPDTDVLHRTCVLQTSSGAGSRKQDLLPPSITAPLPAVPERTAKRGVFSEILSSLGSRRLCRVGPESSRAHSWLEVITPEHLTRPVHTAPQAPPLSQAGLAAPGSVGKGTACPLGCQNSIWKALPQVGVVPGAGVESDTTTLAVNLGNRRLGFLVASSFLGPEVRRSMGGPLGTKGMPGWGHNGGKSGKLGVQSSPGAERLG